MPAGFDRGHDLLYQNGAERTLLVYLATVVVALPGDNQIQAGCDVAVVRVVAARHEQVVGQVVVFIWKPEGVAVVVGGVAVVANEPAGRQLDPFPWYELLTPPSSLVQP